MALTPFRSAQDPADSSTAATPPEVRRRMQPNRLLIIDDEADVASLVAKAARRCDYDVATATRADEFYKLYGSWLPTHVILDLHMPGTDGVELIRFLAGEKSQAHILIMSGFDMKVLDTARRLGAERGLTMSGVLTKPIRIADLQEVLTGLKLTADVIDEEALAQALMRGELFLVYQPKIRLPSMQVAEFESLVRWRHRSGDVISPEEFIPLAERCGLIHRLTQEVAKMAFRQLREWRKNGHAVDMAVNISGKDLFDVGFADDLQSLCEHLEISPGWIILELTETAAAANAVDAMDILTRLRLMGFRLSIDDFGSGYSSLKQLHRLPFSELKVDKEFVRGCATSESDRVIVKTIVDLAHNLGLLAVAEGAEDQATMEALAALGCDCVQGYHISRPLPAEQTVPWMEQWSKRVQDLASPEAKD